MAFLTGMYVVAAFVVLYWAAILVMHINARTIGERSAISGYTFPIVLWSRSDYATHLRGLFVCRYVNLGALWIAVWAARLALIGGIVASVAMQFVRL